MMSNTTTKKNRIAEARRRNRERQRAGHSDRARWRAAPATKQQIEALRLIATETGHTFKADVTRGQAWRRIRQASSLLSERRRLACAPPWYTPLRRAGVEALPALSEGRDEAIEGMAVVMR